MTRRRYYKGRGDYTTKDIVGPSAGAGTPAFEVPQFAPAADEIVISHKEYVQDVFGPPNQAFQNVSLDINPGVQATFNDGNLSRVAPEIRSGAKLLIASSAEQGFTNRLYSVDSLDSVITEFGENSSIAKSLQLARANGAQNVDLVKVNGKQAHFLIKKAIDGADFQKETVIKISPKRTGKMFIGTTAGSSSASTTEVLSGYALALIPFKKGNIFKQRALIYQINNVNQPRTLIYDSEMILARNLASFDIELNNLPGNDKILVTPEFFNTGAVEDFQISLEDAVAAFDNSQIKVGNLKVLSAIQDSDIAVFQVDKTQDSAIDAAYSIVTFQPENIDEVIAMANSTSYGLSATIWTENLTQAHTLAAKLHCGIVWINCWLLRDLRKKMKDFQKWLVQ